MMKYTKKHKPKKTSIVVAKKKSQYLPNHEKLRNMLVNGLNPTITFYFNSHALKATAKNTKGNIKRIVRPTKTIVLNDQFLKDYKGRRKSTSRVLQDIHDIAHDEGAVFFKI